MNYLEWNDLIAENFFNERMADREVLLTLDEQTIQELGSPSGNGLADFINAAIAGPNFIFRKKDLCENAYYSYLNWRKRKLKYPPYIGFLSIFVLAGSIENDRFAVHAYYPRLRSLLGEDPVSGTYPHFNKMHELWEDLEKWSREDRLEEVGRFTVKIRGSWRHVGLPLSQSVLSAKERKMLPVIFYRAEMLVSDIPHGNRLKSLLLENGQDVLLRKTIRLLDGHEDNPQLLQALYELIQSELEMWDGTIPPEYNLIDSTANAYTVVAKSAVKLCLNIDKVTKKVKFTVRINSNHPFPEDDLTFQLRDQQGKLSCTGSTERWSTELRNGNNQLVDGTSFKWLLGEQIDDISKTWKINFKGARIRIFTRGHKLGLQNDYIEVSRLDRGSQFMILCYSPLANKIKEWGNKHCERFAVVDYSNVPKEWVLLAGMNPKESCPGHTELELSSQVTAKLVGGLKIGNGNTFMKGHLPRVVVENLDSTGKVLLQGTPIKCNEEAAYWALPDNLPLHTPLIISIVDVQGVEVRRLMFQIAEPLLAIPDWDAYQHYATGDQELLSTVVGPKLTASALQPITEYPIPLPTHLTFEIIFIGRTPGQVYHYNNDTVPNIPWRPVWAIVKAGRKNWQLIYCSAERSVKESTPAHVSGVESSLNTWKDAIQLMDGRISPSNFPFHEVADLWRKYVEVVKHV